MLQLDCNKNRWAATVDSEAMYLIVGLVAVLGLIVVGGLGLAEGVLLKFHQGSRPLTPL